MSEVLNLLQKYTAKYGKGFDADAFIAAAVDGRASSLNPVDFVKKNGKDSEKTAEKMPEKPNLKNDNGGFKLDFSDGKFTAKGFGDQKGTEISAKNAYEAFMQMNKAMNAGFDAKNYPPEKRTATLHLPADEKNRDKIMKDCFKAAINSNIIMNGDMPQDKAFYAQMKQEFMKNPKNSEKDWNRLTSGVPPKCLPQEKDKDKNKNKDNNDKKQPLPSTAALLALKGRTGR